MRQSGFLTDNTNDLDDFGRLLDTSWKLKRETGTSVSTNFIDNLYMRGMESGALGGKLLGAGGGGFLIFYVQPQKQDSVKKAMNDLMHIPFEFENGGTRVNCIMDQNPMMLFDRTHSIRFQIECYRIL